MIKIENSSLYGTFGDLQYLNDLIEGFEHLYCECLGAGEEEEALAVKNKLDELYEKRYADAARE